MIGFFRWIVGLVITVVIAVFAVMNRDSVPLQWSPVHDPASVPAYIAILGAMAFGFVLGGLVVWMNMSKLRSAKRQQKREIVTLQQEVEKLKSRPPANDVHPSAVPAVISSN